jgi:hypothetical protein
MRSVTVPPTPVFSSPVTSNFGGVGGIGSVGVGAGVSSLGGAGTGGAGTQALVSTSPRVSNIGSEILSSLFIFTSFGVPINLPRLLVLSINTVMAAIH